MLKLNDIFRFSLKLDNSNVKFTRSPYLIAFVSA
jgi:hypothetical protein